ncbi:unnamed protein product [Rotaria sp. Silwood2]|nr:unnamed protein product [Rotaria sp. Silwood2]
MLLDDGNTAFDAERYLRPARILRYYNCQVYDDHIAAHSPKKDNPVCFRCAQHHPYISNCNNVIKCAHCQCDHMAGNASCPFWGKARRYFSSYCPPIEGILHNGVVITSPIEIYDIVKQLYTEQFSEHEHNQSVVGIEAYLIDQELDKELKNSKLYCISIKFMDVTIAVLLLKNKNSTGLDGVSNTIIKLVPSLHLTFITSTSNFMAQKCRSAFIESKDIKSNDLPLFKGVPQGSCVGRVLVIAFHNDILKAVSNLHFKHPFADDFAIALSPSVIWSSQLLILHLSQQISNVIKDVYSYAIT